MARRAARRAPLALAFATALSLSLLGLAARAEQGTEQGTERVDPSTRARLLFERAEKAEARADFASALKDYEAALQASPSAPSSRVALARARDLRAHAEGNFVPLQRLDAVRRKPEPERAEIEALDRDAATFPDGRVRSEARLVVAEAYWHRLNDKPAAVRVLDAVVGDASADKLTKSLALHELVAIHREQGDLQSAHRAVSRMPELVPSLHAEVSRLMRRSRLSRASVVLLGIAFVVGAASLVRLLQRNKRDPEATLKRVVRPGSVAFALYVAGAAAMLVRYHGEGDVRPFLWLGFGLLALDIVARAWNLASRDARPLARLLRALFCGLSVLALAFLSLERANAGYLESFGL